MLEPSGPNFAPHPSLKLHTWFDRAKRNARGRIGYDLDQAVFLLAAMRILKPMSKSKTFGSRDELLFDFNKLSLDDIYHSLDVLADKKKTILSNLNRNLEEIYARVKTIAFYDVTTFSSNLSTPMNLGLEA